MGNSQPKYYSVDQAQEIIGNDVWLRMRKQLERNRGRAMDYESFQKLVRCRYERMVCIK